MDGYCKYLANVDMKKVGRKVIMVAILGVTGLIVLGAINAYRYNNDMDLLSLDGDNWWK